jgi:hypothetical protein
VCDILLGLSKCFSKGVIVSLDIIALLVDKGADVNLRDKNNDTVTRVKK